MIDDASSDTFAGDDSSAEVLIFMMGEFEAEFPFDRLYAKNHMWARVEPESGSGETGGPIKVRFGFTSYAVRLLQDVYFLDWLLDAPAELKQSQEIGSIESKKAESALFAPSDGKLTMFNETLMEDPSAINTDNTVLVGCLRWRLNLRLNQNSFHRRSTLSFSTKFGRKPSGRLKVS